MKCEKCNPKDWTGPDLSTVFHWLEVTMVIVKEMGTCEKSDIKVKKDDAQLASYSPHGQMVVPL